MQAAALADGGGTWYDDGTGSAGNSIQEICCLKRDNTLEIVP